MMSIWLHLLLFLVGLVLLVKGSDYLVDGASHLAMNLGVSSMVVGLTIVAYGTSLPEFAVSFAASLGGMDDIALGNIIGSNIANICLILGLSAVIRPLKVHISVVKKEMLIMLGAALAMTFMLWDGEMDRIDGAILLIGFAAYLTFFVHEVIKANKSEAKHQHAPFWRNALIIVGGLVAVSLGARLLVDSSVSIARQIEVSEYIIGLTVIAVGTSLPELATSAMASYKNKGDIAVGNIIGSISFNILLVLGACAVILPLVLHTFFDLYLMCGVCALILGLFRTGLTLTRLEGVLLLIGYGAYMAYLFL
ncbi:MAG: calcium/sodium antiporter [Methanocellales archaeon]|nr:calcium/sodium antiporter [Methanocellales archaeon]